MKAGFGEYLSGGAISDYKSGLAVLKLGEYITAKG
jgi:hypothetical protein